MIHFSQATKTDLAAVHDVTRRAYAKWEPVLGYAPLPVIEDHAPRIERGEVLLALEGGVIGGLIVVQPETDHDLIFSVAVDPDMRGKGIGKVLIAEAERRTRESGKASMRLYTNTRMEQNIALYHDLGYRETGRRPVPGRQGFFIVDMEKMLIEG